MEDADLVLVLGDPDCEGATDQVVRVAAKCSTTGTTYLEGGRSRLEVPVGGAGGGSQVLHHRHHPPGGRQVCAT